MLTFAVHAPSLGLLPVPVLSSEKPVWEQYSFSFADFCYPRLSPPLGLLLVPVLSSEKLVWEQHSFTFPKAASFVLAVNTGHIEVLRRKTCALLRAKTSALLRRKTCCVES